MFSSGDLAATEVDLRAIDRHTQVTCIPHEVKAPWAERHTGDHFTDLLQDLLQDPEKRKGVARAAAQILYYMVRIACIHIGAMSRLPCVYIATFCCHFYICCCYSLHESRCALKLANCQIDFLQRK